MYADIYRAYIARDTSIQRQLGVTADGRWGPRTEAAALDALDLAWAHVCAGHGWTWRKVGRQHPRRVYPTRSIWHWPGDTSTARSLGDLWQRRDATTGTSSHCGIDETGVVWYAGPHCRTNHAAGHNVDSIGLDICVPVIARDRAAAERRGVFVGERDWVSAMTPNGGRHRHRILDLDPWVAARCGDLRREVDELLGELVWTDHHAVDRDRKWDVDPWAPTLIMHGAIDRRLR